MDVARARRKVYEEIVQLAPMGIFDELFDSIRGHASAPYDRALGVDKETDREHLHTILLDRLNERAALFLHRVRTGVLASEHLRHRRTMDIRIQQSYGETSVRQSYRKVRCHRGFAYSALAAMYGDDMFGVYFGAFVFERSGLLTFDFILGVYLHRHIGVYIGLECRFGGFHHRFHEGVVVFRENQGEGHLKARDTDIVLQHTAFYQILARSRVPHMPKCIYYLLRIHEKYLRFTDLRCTIYLRFFRCDPFPSPCGGEELCSIGRPVVVRRTKRVRLSQFAPAKLLLFFDMCKKKRPEGRFSYAWQPYSPSP